MSLRTNTLPLLRRGTSYVARFHHHANSSATIFLRALTNDAQATVRSARTTNSTDVTAADVFGATPFKGQCVRIDLPQGSPLNPYVFVDCTAGQISVEIVSSERFVSQLRG